MIRSAALAAACAAALAGCATTPGYAPPPVGASELELEPGRFRVTYRGTSRMSDAEVRDRALLRAAETTLARGSDWFSIVDRYEELAAPTGPRFTIGIGSTSFGRRSALGVGGATSFGGEATVVSTLEVVMGRGERPRGADVYDARSVSDTLRARLPAG